MGGCMDELTEIAAEHWLTTLSLQVIEEDAQRLEETTRALNEERKRYRLNMNFEKNKHNGIWRKGINREIVNRRQALQ